MGVTPDKLPEFFGPVVFSYTAEQAVEDGVLVSIGDDHMVTRAVWEWMVEKFGKTVQSPSCWPVEMMVWFRAEAMKHEDALRLIAEHGKDGAQVKFARIIGDRRALAAARGLIGKYEQQARAQRTTDGRPRRQKGSAYGC